MVQHWAVIPLAGETCSFFQFEKKGKKIGVVLKIRLRLFVACFGKKDSIGIPLNWPKAKFQTRLG